MSNQNTKENQNECIGQHDYHVDGWSSPLGGSNTIVVVCRKCGKTKRVDITEDK